MSDVSVFGVARNSAAKGELVEVQIGSKPYVVELIRDDGSVAGVVSVPSLRDRIEFETGLQGTMTHARVTFPDGTRHMIEIDPKIYGGRDVTCALRIAEPPYVNPACRWYHGDESHELGITDGEGRILCTVCPIGFSPAERFASNFTDVNWLSGQRAWFGFPKPAVAPLDAATQHRFHHVRDHAWLQAIGPEQRTLAEVQADMADWPHLLAFHLWCAAWLPLSHDDRSVHFDAWEERHLGTACNGQLCGEPFHVEQSA